MFLRTPAVRPLVVGILAFAAVAPLAARADPGSDEANRQSMMADMRASRAANEAADFNSNQRQQADRDRFNTPGSSGSGSSSSAAGIGYPGGSANPRAQPSGPQSIVASYNFTMIKRETPSLMLARLKAEAVDGNALSAFNLGRVYYTGFADAPQDDAEARRWFGEAAKLGHPGGQAQYGSMPHYGVGGPADPAAATPWLKKSAEHGDTYGEALYGYFVVRAYKSTSSADLSEAITYLTRAADKGQLVAQATLGGSVYAFGIGAPTDPVKAARYNRLAADQGYAPAMVDLGKAYYFGNGVSHDDAVAVNWLRNAFAKNDREATGFLGHMMIFGQGGIAVDITNGVAMVKRAADAGDMESMGFYGVLMQQGMGMPKDEGGALKFLKTAAESHNGAAEQAYAVTLFNAIGVPKDDAQGVYWQKRAADDGDTGAAAAYGVRLFNALGVPKDHVSGLVYARSAAAAGNARGQASLGYAYWNGWGVPKDQAQGLDWFRKAAAGGDADAIGELKAGDVATYATAQHNR